MRMSRVSVARTKRGDGETRDVTVKLGQLERPVCEVGIGWMAWKWASHLVIERCGKRVAVGSHAHQSQNVTRRPSEVQ